MLVMLQRRRSTPAWMQRLTSSCSWLITTGWLRCPEARIWLPATTWLTWLLFLRAPSVSSPICLLVNTWIHTHTHTIDFTALEHQNRESSHSAQLRKSANLTCKYKELNNYNSAPSIHFPSSLSRSGLWGCSPAATGRDQYTLTGCQSVATQGDVQSFTLTFHT